MRLSSPVEKRLSIKPGNCDLAWLIALEFEGSKLERKDGPIKGTSSVAMMSAVELAVSPNRDVINALSRSIMKLLILANTRRLAYQKIECIGSETQQLLLFVLYIDVR